MSDNKGPEMPIEQHQIPAPLNVHYRYHVGALASSFFVKLRDEKKINGIKCSKCNKVIMPPRSVCLTCFSNLDESMFVELSGEGTVETFTVINYSEPIQPVDFPFVYAIIKMDGADTGLLHILGEVDLAKVKTGMRVKPVFAKQRNGNIKDIQYFKPV